MKTLSEKRREAGRKGGKNKKGHKLPKTLEKEHMMERIRQRVFKMTDKLIDAQAIVAVGTHKMIHMYKDADGIHTETIRDMDRMQDLLDNGKYGIDYVIVAGSEPDHKAASALMDRAYGKPTESIEHSGKDGQPLIIRLDE